MPATRSFSGLEPFEVVSAQGDGRTGRHTMVVLSRQGADDARHFYALDRLVPTVSEPTDGQEMRAPDAQGVKRLTAVLPARPLTREAHALKFVASYVLGLANEGATEISKVKAWRAFLTSEGQDDLPTNNPTYYHQLMAFATAWDVVAQAVEIDE